MRRALVAIFGVLVFAAGCLFPSLDGLGGSGDAQTNEAAADAGGEAGFCASLSPPATFCDDFDHGALGATWTKTQLVGPGAVLELNPLARTPPSSLHSLVADSGAGGTASLVEALPGTANVIDYTFDLYVARKPTIEKVEICGVGVTIGQDEYYVDVFLGPEDDANMEHDGPSGYVEGNSVPLSQPLATGKWMNASWHLVVAPDAGGPSATLEVDGQILFSASLPSYGYAPGTPWVVGGIGYQPTTADGAEIYVDDVVVRVDP
jgi:hypothetical protein